MSLRERREIVALAQSATAGVLMALVRAAGSSYRNMGARLLAMPDGRTAGTISGGCLEADLLRRAAWRVRSGAAVEHFNTSFDETEEIPFGLGCGGVVDVLLESIAEPEARALVNALQLSLRGEAHGVATQLPGDGVPLARVITDPNGNEVFASEHLSADAKKVLLQHARMAVVYPGHMPLSVDEGRHGCFVERLAPPQRLVIFGAGEDARPLVRLATDLGYGVVVADGRAQQARAHRFPGADRVLVAESAAAVPVLADDAVVLMTHSYAQDLNLLTELLTLRPTYLGLLGARHRSALLLQQAATAAGIAFEDAIAHTHSPIGLQLGGDGPEAIALAILAEVHLVLHGRPGPAQPRRMTLAEAQEQLRARSNPQGEPISAAACALDSFSG